MPAVGRLWPSDDNDADVDGDGENNVGDVACGVFPTFSPVDVCVMNQGVSSLNKLTRGEFVVSC